MKYVIMSICFLFTKSLFGQVLDLSTAQTIISKETSFPTITKLLASNFKYKYSGDTSNAGNITWNFESKDASNYPLILLYSAPFKRVTYLQFYDNINMVSIYKSTIQKLGYRFQGTKYSKGGEVQQSGFTKDKSLFVIEIGSYRGMCKLHFSKLD